MLVSVKHRLSQSRVGRNERIPVCIAGARCKAATDFFQNTLQTPLQMYLTPTQERVFQETGALPMPRGGHCILCMDYNINRSFSLILSLSLSSVPL